MLIQTKAHSTPFTPDLSVLAHEDAKRKLRELALHAARMRYFS